MCVPPFSPRWFHVLILGTPFNSHRKLLTVDLRSFFGADKIILGCVMRLAESSQMFNPQVFQLDVPCQ